MAATAGSETPKRCASTSNVQRSPSWVCSASNMSNRISPCRGAYPFGGTNLSFAFGSMNRLISQALAIRSTCTPLRVTHTPPRTPSGGWAASRGSMADARSRLFERGERRGRLLTLGSGEEVEPGDLGLPPTEAGQGRHPDRALAFVQMAAFSQLLEGVADLLRQNLVVLASRPVEERLDCFVGRPAYEARLAERRLAAAGRNLAREPAEALQRLVPAGQRVD